MAWLDELPAPYRFNILIVGSERAAEAELERVRPLLPDPVHTCQLPGPLQLPDKCGAALILLNVGALNVEQQAELIQWLDRSERGPVVSLHPSSLFDCVRAGQFSADLYYRLNTVLQTAGGAADTVDGRVIGRVTGGRRNSGKKLKRAFGGTSPARRFRR